MCVCGGGGGISKAVSIYSISSGIAALIPHKFETVGLQLGLTLGELQVIGPHHPSLSEQLTSWIIEGSGDP